jgi:hypothetical protein
MTLLGELRESYYEAAKAVTAYKALHQPGCEAVLRGSKRSLAGYLMGVQPVRGLARERAAAAAAWLLLAQRSTPDDGVSLGHFPTEGGWKPSYPETTGYIITSLLAYADWCGALAAAQAAHRMAAWEIAVQMPSGAVQGGPVCPPAQQKAAAFNTGMVLDGWCSAYQRNADPEVLAAARRAADFLVGDMDAQGFLTSHGPFVSAARIKVFTVLCGWSLYRFGMLCGEDAYKAAAVRLVDAALTRQLPSGWFADNCLTHPDAPLTHTIGYTLQGIFEVGVLAGREDFVQAARRGLDPVLKRIGRDGYLPGRFRPDWTPAGLSCCLTGSAQIAIICYRVHQETGEPAYRAAADRLVDFLKAVQRLDSGDENIDGALPGSFPFLGDYMRARYPNWATKYLLDALMLQAR